MKYLKVIRSSRKIWDGKSPSNRTMKLRPRPHVAGYFEKRETFSSEYGYLPHVSGVFGHRKRRFSNTLSRVESFENGDSSYSCTRAKTVTFKYDDVMPKLKARSLAHTIRKRYVWTQILLNTEEKTSVFENTRLRVDGEIRFKNATCGPG